MMAEPTYMLKFWNVIKAIDLKLKSNKLLRLMVRRSKRINKKDRKPKKVFSKEENRLYNQFKVEI